jgi:hypothetical protein
VCFLEVEGGGGVFIRLNLSKVKLLFLPVLTVMTDSLSYYVSCFMG